MNIELLAPAKNLACGIAAIDHGADAVYIGARSFGARHAAGNSIEDIKSLCDYAHQFMAKVYATVNTIVYDDELDEAVRLVRQLDEAGVDAILVQDFGLLTILRKELKDSSIALHASTQTDNRTIEKVKWLRAQGFRRAVLARELTLDEIKAVHEAVPDMELEVFVHGALCVSYSGQCYASQHCFGRSANRGECAQFCRLKFQLEDAQGRNLDDMVGGNSSDGYYYLSLKDQCQIDNLEKIIEAGACSLKIEGRLKDIAYVKNVVGAYSQKLDTIIRRSGGKYQRASIGRTELKFEPDLKRSFNRGYTDYFINGRNNDITSLLTPKAIGEYVGRVKTLQSSYARRDRGNSQPSFVVSGLASFANGDGLCFMNDNGELTGFRVNRVEGNRLFPMRMPNGLRPGVALYRNQDQEFDRIMASNTAQRTIPIRVCFDENLRLTMTSVDGMLRGEAILDKNIVQGAEKPQLQNMERQLTKLGGTIYSVDSITIDAALEKVFIPSSVLADLRRRTIENLAKVEKEMSLKVDGKVEQVSHPGYEHPHLYNIANTSASAFYGVEKPSAYELQVPKGDVLLMQCRHCLRYSLGYCSKQGKKLPWPEPLYLRLADGSRYRLEFDCRHCQMNVFS